MKLLIAEKPSQAKSIKDAINESFKNCDGYFESKNWIITWGYGHLYGLADVEQYTPDYSKSKKYSWSDTSLPYYPINYEFKWVMKPDTQKQIKIINALMNDSQIDEIIGATDTDEEGEAIYQNIIQKGLKTKKKITRIFPADQTPGVIWKSIQNRKPYANYKGMYDEALVRAYADWLIGINLTRGLTLKTGELIRVGRVITAIVNTIDKRDTEIQDFKTSTYYQIESNENGLRLATSTKYETKEEAQKEATRLNSQKAIVKSVNNKEVEKARPKLYSQATLQSAAGDKLKLKPDETLAICQQLYESKLTSYPRTNSEYLTTNEKVVVEELLKVHENGACDVNVNNSIFNNKKVEAHSGLLPTISTSFNGSQNAKKIYEMILTRLKSSFCKEPCIYYQTKAIIEIGDTKINITGQSRKQAGWEEIENIKPADTTLPVLSEGMELNHNFVVKTKQTTPPQHYSIKTLNNYCLAPFKKSEIDTSDDEELYKEILSGATLGQESSRATIIKNAVDNGLITLEKGKYQITKKGHELCKLLNENNIDLSAEKTVEIQKLIKKVGKGEITINQALDKVKEFIDSSFSAINKIQKIEVMKMSAKTCKCPACGEDLYRRTGKYGVFYAHEKDHIGCNLIIGQNFKYYGQDIKFTETQLDNLVNGKTVKKTGLKDKYGEYDAKITLSEECSEWNGKIYPKLDVEKIR